MKPWTTVEVTYLTQNGHLGAKHLAANLERTERSVRVKASEIGVSLRQPGSRRGLLLGQPRGTRWLDQPEVMPKQRLARLRDDILRGRVNLPELLASIRDQMDNPQPVCPKCTVRQVQRPQTGLCHVCHLRELARAHRDEDELQEAKRELWRARQERSRATRRQAGGDADA